MRNSRDLLLIAWLCAALAACAGAPDRPPAPRPQTEAQKKLLQQADVLFRDGGSAFDKAVDACKADPLVVAWLARAMYLHMVEAERLHRQAEAGRARNPRRRGADPKGMVAPSLEENPRYVRARAAIARLGNPVVDLVLEDWLLHRQRAVGNHGIEIAAEMGVGLLPRLRQEMPQVEPRMRERIVRCVAMMRAPNQPEKQQVEAQLLDWASSDDRFVRAGALSGLARFGRVHLPQLCIAVRQDPDDFVRRQLAKVLARHRTREAAAALIAFYERAQQERDGLSTKIAEDALRAMARVPPRVVNQQIRPYGLVAWRRWAAGMTPDKEQN